MSTIGLPEPRLSGHLPLESAIARRRSLREFADRSLSLTELGQLLFAAQGITSAEGHRTVPAAGALFPLEVLAVIGNVDGAAPGVYRYRPATHALELIVQGDRRSAVCAAALHQDWFRKAPLLLVVSAVVERTARKYGARAERYVQIEVGCAVQNIALQAVAMDLGTVLIGAFDDDRLAEAVGLQPPERPLAVLPIGEAG